MYAGPGSGPMMAAAAAWDELAAELATAASGYGSVVSELTSAAWVGPASNTTTPDAPADQALAVAQAQATPAGNSAQNIASVTPQLTSATAAPAAQAPAAATTTTGPFSWLQNFFNNLLTQGLPTPTNN